MKNYLKHILGGSLVVAGLVLGSIFFQPVSVWASAFVVGVGGTGTTSVPTNQILTGNGTSAFNSNTATGTSPYGINISTGCFAIGGNCLASGGSGITDIGAGGATTTGPKVTISTTTSATNGITSALTAIVSGTQVNFTPSQSGTRTVAGGGTGAATFTAGIVGASGTNAFFTTASTTLAGTGGISVSNSPVVLGASGAVVSCSTCVLSTLTLTVAGTANQITSSAGAQDLTANRTWTLSLPSLVIFPGNASSTQFSSGAAYFGQTATTTITTAGFVGIATSSPYAPLSVVGSGGVVADHYTATGTAASIFPNASTTALSINSKAAIADRYITVTYATTTAWTGTTTLLYLGAAPFGMTWNNVLCTTDAGTLNTQFQYGSGPSLTLPMLNASTTVGTVTFTSVNTPAKGNVLGVKFGTPASSPTSVSCTLDATITSL